MPPPKPRPFTPLILLLCVGWTAQVLFFDKSPLEAGALTRAHFWLGQYWRLLTATLLHGDWLHLILNGVALCYLGSAVERGCGRLILILTIAFGALAGWAASLLWYDENIVRVGISGGLAALLGLIPALEWCQSRTFPEFITRRNTVVVLFFLLLNAAIAVYLEKNATDLRLDHAAHIGGFLFGLLAGLACYTRRGFRPERGIAAVALLAVLPIVYAAYPYWDVDYFLFRARHGGDVDAYERVLELEPGHAEACIALALDRDEPKYLQEAEGARPTPLVQAYLQLASNRFESDPEGARTIVERADRILGADPFLWFRFAQAAHAAGRPGIAAIADEQATRMPESQSWRSAARLLAIHGARLQEPGIPPEELLARAERAAELARRAAAGLGAEAEVSERELEALEQGVIAFTEGLMKTAELVEAQDPRELYDLIRRILQRLARNTRDEGRAPNYLLAEATWAERAGDKDAPSVARAAVHAAREQGKPAVEKRALDWLEERGLELAGDGDGG